MVPTWNPLDKATAEPFPGAPGRGSRARGPCLGCTPARFQVHITSSLVPLVPPGTMALECPSSCHPAPCLAWSVPTPWSSTRVRVASLGSRTRRRQRHACAPAPAGSWARAPAFAYPHALSLSSSGSCAVRLAQFYMCLCFTRAFPAPSRVTRHEVVCRAMNRHRGLGRETRGSWTPIGGAILSGTWTEPGRGRSLPWPARSGSPGRCSGTRS